MVLPIDVIRDRMGRVSYRWGDELHAVGLPPHVQDAAAQLGVPAKTLRSRLQRGDRGERLTRALQRRPHHTQRKKRNRK